MRFNFQAGRTRVGLLLVILALVVVLLGVCWVLVSWQEKNEATLIAPATTATDNLTAASTGAVPSPASSQSATATLTDSTGEDVIGEAVMEKIDSGQVKVSIIVKLPLLSGGESYAVWLTKEDDSGAVSLGKLEISGDQYQLDYTADDLDSGLDHIVISQQQTAAQSRGTTVGAGEFGSQLLL
jgi:hypothetical protein